MSIVEKAVEKLKNTRPQEPVELKVAPSAEPGLPYVTSKSSVERLQERIGETHAAAEKTPVWHVDIEALKRVGVLPSEEAAPRLADELRRIKRPLLANITGNGAVPVDNGHRIMIASSLPGEGKTFTALNLALSLAMERDFEVLLVDGDAPKCDLTRLLKLEDRPGLMEVLADEQLQPANVIVRTDVPNLLVVPVGGRNPLAAELFSSRRMEYVLREFSGQGRRRLLVFDSPPLLATSEAQVLAPLMGQIILVVAAGSTQQQSVKSAIDTLTGCKCINLILNRARLPAGEDHYGNYYSRYYKDR